MVVRQLREHPAELDLLPAEEALVRGAVDRRRREFAAVRRCARGALAALGFPPEPILAGERGDPIWPAGVVGSMTHCHGYAAAALGPSTSVLGIGVDAEPEGPLPEGVEELICLPQERVRLADLAREDPRLHWDRLLFSAKESVYKTWYPLMRTWLDFDQVQIDVDPHHGTFLARLLVPGPVVAGRQYDEFAGRWTAAGGLIVTAIVLHRDL